MKIKKTVALFCATLMIASLSACKPTIPTEPVKEPPTPIQQPDQGVYDPLKDPDAAKNVSDIFIAMDTPITLKVYGKEREAAMSAAKAKIIELENLISKTIATSDIARLNAAEGKPVQLDPIVVKLLEENNRYYALFGGDFDVTVEPVVELWGIGKEGTVKPPDDAKIKKLLPLIGNEKLVLEGDTAHLKDGAKIDLGAIAKGYASDVLFEVLDQYDVSAALFSLGGNVGAYGLKADGSTFNIGVRDPAGAPEDYVATLGIQNAFMVSSGNYERFFEYEGKRYHHIMDPQTGYPSDSDIVAVTIITPNGTYADALSTALFVKGYEKSMEFYKEHKDFEAIFITKDNLLRVTDGLGDVLNFIGNDTLKFVK